LVQSPTLTPEARKEVLWFVASKEDARRPHSVKVLDFGWVTCDKRCIWWEGHNICSYTVAVAEKTKMLAKCLQWLRSWTKTGTQTKGGAPNTSGQENKATQRRKGRSNTTVTAPLRVSLDTAGFHTVTSCELAYNKTPLFHLHFWYN